MPRARTISDAEILGHVCGQLLLSGEKSVSFASIAALTGLAAPTLVQRYGSRRAMQAAALAQGWQRLEQITAAAEAEALASPKGAAALLKAIGDAPEIQLLALSWGDDALRALAANWRQGVETALAKRLGGGPKGQTSAAIAFAAWQGRLLWAGAGGKGFRLSDLLRK